MSEYETKVIQRPDWWEPSMPLPALGAYTVHTGHGLINRMKQVGGATSKLVKVRWESISEWRERNTRHTPKGNPDE